MWLLTTDSRLGIYLFHLVIGGCPSKKGVDIQINIAGVRAIFRRRGIFSSENEDSFLTSADGIISGNVQMSIGSRELVLTMPGFLAFFS